MKIAIISSIIPRHTRGGELVLHQLFQAMPGDIQVHVFSEAPADEFLSTIIKRRFWSRLLHKLKIPEGVRLYFESLCNPFNTELLANELSESEPDVILTVAHGQLCYLGMAFAAKHKKPLVTIFHDWWPDLIEAPSFVKRRFDARFRELGQESTIRLPVCEGMSDWLVGGHKGAVFPPLAPSSSPRKIAAKSTNAIPVLRYLGNISEYGPIIQSLLIATDGDQRIAFEVRGSNPTWSDELTARMTKAGKYGGKLRWDEVDRWLLGADVLLTAMSFDPQQRRQVETSFPSKLAHYSSLGMPLIVWGPDYCSAIRWAKGITGCLLVTEPDPEAVIEKIASLKHGDLERLSANSSEIFAQYFGTEVITEQFFNSLRQSCRSANNDLTT